MALPPTYPPYQQPLLEGRTGRVTKPWQLFFLSLVGATDLAAAHQRGTRAAQPAASAVVPGTLYCVTDEGNALERSDGTSWQPYAPSGGVSLSAFDFSDQITAPPTSSQLRFNAAAPYTAATKLWVRFQTSDGMDAYWRLRLVSPGATVFVQDKNDHTLYVRCRTTGVSVDQTTYMELPIVWVTGSGTLLNNQAILLGMT